MAYELIDSVDRTKHPRYIDIYLPIAGHKAIEYWWNTEDGEDSGFWEPWQTSPFAFATVEEAYRYAKMWGQDEELPVLKKPDLE